MSKCNTKAEAGNDIEREPHYLTRAFWQGSDTHRHGYWNNMLRLLLSLHHYPPKIKMVMSGYADNNSEWDQMAATLTLANFKHQYKIIPFEPVTQITYSHYAQCWIYV